MPTVTKLEAGTFCWVELATTDEAAASKFYSTLFGWTERLVPMGEAGQYHIFTLGGRDAAAMYKMMPDMMKAGVPPHWGAYVAVDDVDATTKRAESLGAKVVAPPMDVMEQGRMAVLSDPSGAVISVWQAKAHSGIGVAGEPGALAWVQLNTTDTAKVKPFYSGLFGWAFRDDPMQEGGQYTTWMRGNEPTAGMMPMPPNAGAPPHWLSYFAVTNVNESHAKAVSLGAKSHVPPTPIPAMGEFAVLADPQGAFFAIARFDAK